MDKTYAEEEVFEGVDFKKNPLPKGDYENCTFINCLFANSDLSHINFIECEFKSCDFSAARLANTAFRDVIFKTCKLLGLHFEECNQFLFSPEFNECLLNLSTFYKLNLKHMNIERCKLHEVDFTETDLTGAVFSDCDLTGAIFDRTILEKADLRTAENFSINPEINRIRKARFSLTGVVGLLDKYDIILE